MILQGLHEKELFSENVPFRVRLNTADQFEYPPHWHSAIELVYAIEKETTVSAQSREYILSEKDILIIPGGELHGFRANSPGGKRLFLLYDLAFHTHFGNIKQVTPILNKTKLISRIENPALHGMIEEHINQFLKEFEQKEFAYELSLNARISDILVLISRELLKSGNVSSHTKKSYGFEKLDLAFQYVEEHYKEPISLGDVSKAAGFSEYYFSRIFKEFTEKFFHDYLNEFRLKKAEKILSQSDVTVAEAAHSAGFNSIATFNRVFKEHHGGSPSDYKKIRG